MLSAEKEKAEGANVSLGPKPSIHRPQFAPLQPESASSTRLPACPADTKTFSDMYPERRGKEVKFNAWHNFTGKNLEVSFRQMCHTHVIDAFTEVPMVRTLLGALEAQGCPIKLERHVSCDICSPDLKGVASKGGYDERVNQIFVCANHSRSKSEVYGNLVKGLIAAFDRCTGKTDYRDVDHLACTEVRKANLADCDLSASLSRPDGNFAIRRQHAHCVRNTAVESMVKIRFMDRMAAETAVDRVFKKCYSDLEPFGRRCRNVEDMQRAHSERYLLGYK